MVEVGALPDVLLSSSSLPIAMLAYREVAVLDSPWVKASLTSQTYGSRRLMNYREAVVPSLSKRTRMVMGLPLLGRIRCR